MKRIVLICLVLLIYGCGDGKKKVTVSEAIAQIPQPEAAGEADLPPMPPVLD